MEWKEKFERFTNTMICNFDNIIKAKDGMWFLDKDTLIEFICNKRLKEPIHLGLIGCSEEKFRTRMGRFEIKNNGNNKYTLSMMDYNINVTLYKDLNKDLIRAPQEEFERHIKKHDTAMSVHGIWRYNIDGTHWYHLPVPYKVGTFLDNTQPLWFTKIKYIDDMEISNDVFFTEKRTENAVELMGLLRDCADKAGFGNYIFPAFGTLLGIIREGKFINSDRDLDHGIAGWKISREQEERFITEVARERTILDKNNNPVKYLQGLYTGRCRKPQRRSDNNRFLWTSVGHKKVHSQKGCKSCVWKFFLHKDFAWHSKGKKWISDRKFNMDAFEYSGETQAIAKGMPASCLEEFIEMEFKGIKINVPKLSGHCLDAWYPGWARPRREKSSKKNILIITKWNEENKWKLV